LPPAMWASASGVPARMTRVLALVALSGLSSCEAFVMPQQRGVAPLKGARVEQRIALRRRETTVVPKMTGFAGGGFLGVGTPELIVVCAVGYFLLGPSELYKLAKDVGKLVSQARQALADSAAEWQSTMDGQLDFQEIRDVQNAARELQEAFNFRSERYMQEWRDYKKPIQPLPELLDETESFPSQLDVDDWNAEILKKDEAPVLDREAPVLTLTEQKRKALERIERDFEQKRRQLELEFEYERQKVQIELAESEADLPPSA